MYSEIHNMCKSLYRVELFISVQIISSAFTFYKVHLVVSNAFEKV